MISIKQKNWKIFEITCLGLIYVLLLINMFVFKDSSVAVCSAFFGITYTVFAGKGNPICYIFGVSGSGLYSWLSFIHCFWGNLFLYMLYYIPMQVMGFFKWNKNLKNGENEIIKTRLTNNERFFNFSITAVISAFAILLLFYTHDKNPIIDGITTVFSIFGMYLTVRRCIEQWVVWIIVNGLSAIMWIDIAINGAKVYSTVTMWVVYFCLAIYFYVEWKKEIYSK